MHTPGRPSSRHVMLTLGIFAGVAVGQFALAAPEARHTPPGIGGAPALGDVEAWVPRLAQGRDTLIHHAVNGYSGDTGIMPKKGGRTDLSDEEIIAAVDFMVEEVAH